jgi:pectin methylesterase-like acyl-CoA thioesterase
MNHKSLGLTRPQLTDADAANYTIAKYLAQMGTLGSLTTDNWDPTAAVAWDPTAAVATSGRAYSPTGNRFYEYCNSGPGAGP